ncbi:MAG: IS1182 family transposase [Steroidobacteraceae bacterium]
MSRHIHADYKQPMLFPLSVEDWIGPDHPARFVRARVDAMDLKALGFRVAGDGAGRPAFSDELLLKVVLYGWMTKIRSARAIEQACRDVMPMIWLSGKTEPDHNTIWRFLKRSEKALQKVFRLTVTLASELGLVSMVMNALDGTKIPAVSSMESGDHAASLKRRAEKLEAAIKETYADIQREIDEAKDLPSDRLPEELRTKQALKAKIDEKLAQLEKAGRNHMNPNEPEAEVLKLRGGKKEFGYNAQTVVDAKARIIVAQEVVTDANDQKQLVPMIQKAEETVGRRADVTLADSGYHTGTAIEQAEQTGLNILVNEPRGPSRDDGDVDLSHKQFKYDEAQDSCQCPTGPMLDLERAEKTNKQGIPVKVFRCHHGATCPLAAICSTDKRGRSIEIAPFHGAVERQRAKRNGPEGRALIKQRGSLVEQPYADIKSTLGFWRFTHWGLAGAKLQWALGCAVYNLRRLMKLTWKPAVVM